MRAKLLLAFLVLHTFSLKAQNKVIEDKVLDAVFQLKEVKEMSDLVRKQTKGKHRLVLFVNDRPSKKAPYYWIKAWEDREYDTRTIFDFFVDPKTLKIRYYDSVTDSAISLEEWRRRNRRQISDRLK